MNLRKELELEAIKIQNQNVLAMIADKYKYEKIAALYLGYGAYLFLGSLICLIFGNDLFKLPGVLLERNKENEIIKDNLKKKPNIFKSRIAISTFTD